MSASPPARPVAASGEVQALRQRLAAACQIAVLTGAGMSAESGVPTFRDDSSGYWSQFNPQEMASEAGFRAHPQRVWNWYAHRRAVIARVEPNAGHLALARWSRTHEGRMSVITQNVDGLHQRAGSAGVLALHGELMRNRWLDRPRSCCDLQRVAPGEPPSCPVCGNLLRPAVVWFGEALPASVWQAAEQAAQGAEVLLVVGTSGAVYPAAGLAQIARRSGAHVVVINTQATELDAVASQCLTGSAARLLPALFD